MSTTEVPKPSLAEARELINARLPEGESVSKEWVRLQVKSGRIRADKGAARTAAYQLNEYDVKRVAEIEAHERRKRLYGGGYGPAGREAAVAAAAEFNGWTPEQHAEALERLHERARQQELLDRVQREMSTDLRRQFEELDEDIAIERTAHEIANRVRREERIRRRAAQILADDDEHHDA